MSREEARLELAKAELARLSAAKRAAVLEEWWSVDADDFVWTKLPASLQEELVGSESPEDAGLERYEPLLVLALMERTVGVVNSWLQAKLEAQGETCEVSGTPEARVECPCCRYGSLPGRGNYDICPVCFWEDDGATAPERHSGPNHMTLMEGRANFERLGACSADMLPQVDPEGREKYARGAPSWNVVESEFPVGTKVRGVVVRTEPYGVWLRLEALGVQAVLLVTHFEDGDRAFELSEYPSLGTRVEAVVVDHVEDSQQIRLSTRKSDLQRKIWP